MSRAGSATGLSTLPMSDNQADSVQCVAVTYVSPYNLIGGVPYLEVILELIDGREVSYLVSRPAVQSLLQGLTFAESLARS